jgi:profilin
MKIMEIIIIIIIIKLIINKQINFNLIRYIMSWQDYINGYLLNNTDPNTGKTATNVSQHAAIVGNTDGTLWAGTPNFSLQSYSFEVEKDDGTTTNVQFDEFKNLADAFANNGFTNLPGGIRINNEKYFSVNFDSERNVLYLKKSGGGAAVAKSNLGFVIATFSSSLKTRNYHGAEEPQNPGLVNKAVEDLQKFLVENNL